MVRYKCWRCGAKLESDDTVGGGKDQCPGCGALCDVPMSKIQKLAAKEARRQQKAREREMRSPDPAEEPDAGAVPAWRRPRVLAVAFGATLIFISVFLIARATFTAHRPRESEDVRGAQPSVGTDNADQYTPPKMEFLREKGPQQASGGYYAWILIDPLPRAKLELLGRWLVARMKQRGGDHLKAWLFYDRADFNMDMEVIWIGATRSGGYEVQLSGALPDRTDSLGLFRAYLEWDHLVSEERVLGGVSCEYDSDTGTLVYHDQTVANYTDRLSMPAVILQMVKMYLPGESRACCWPALPGLNSVIVHHYSKGSTDPAVTMRYSRQALRAATAATRQLYDRRRPLDEAHGKLYKRYRARVMSMREYKRQSDAIAMQVYKLYESVWVEAALHVLTDVPRKLPEVSPSYFGRYFYYGSL